MTPDKTNIRQVIADHIAERPLGDVDDLAIELLTNDLAGTSGWGRPRSELIVRFLRRNPAGDITELGQVRFDDILAAALVPAATTDQAPAKLTTSLQNGTAAVEEQRPRYRVLGPDGRLWLESSNPADVTEIAADEKGCTFERISTFTVRTSWEPWNPGAAGLA